MKSGENAALGPHRFGCMFYHGKALSGSHPYHKMRQSLKQFNGTRMLTQDVKRPGDFYREVLQVKMEQVKSENSWTDVSSSQHRLMGWIIMRIGQREEGQASVTQNRPLLLEKARTRTNLVILINLLYYNIHYSKTAQKDARKPLTAAAHNCPLLQFNTDESSQVRNL